MGGLVSGLDAFEEAQAWEGVRKDVTHRKTYREKSDSALKLQHQAETKFKALVQGTHAKMTGPASPLRPIRQAFPREAHGAPPLPQVQQLWFQGLI